MQDIVKIQSDVCKTFSNPSRLAVLKLLCTREYGASELCNALSLSKNNLSQHMAQLTGKGVVMARKEGVNVYYALADKRMATVCSLMQEVVTDIAKRKHTLIQSQTRRK